MSNLTDSKLFEPYRMGSLTLARFSQFYHTDRILRLYRRDGSFEVMQFKGADLRGTTDVIVLAGSALPKSKAARQQHVLTLAELGIEKNPKRIKDMLELGTGEPDDMDKSYAQADRENHAMIMGVLTRDTRFGGGLYDPTASFEGNISMEGGEAAGGNGGQPVDQVAHAIPVFKWHNHEAHLERHYGFMMGEEFEHLAVTSPDIVRLFNEHTSVHEQELARKRQEQLQMLLAARGGPGGENAPAGVQQAAPGSPDVLNNLGDIMGQMSG